MHKTIHVRGHEVTLNDGPNTGEVTATLHLKPDYAAGHGQRGALEALAEDLHALAVDVAIEAAAIRYSRMHNEEVARREAQLATTFAVLQEMEEDDRGDRR